MSSATFGTANEDNAHLSKSESKTESKSETPAPACGGGACAVSSASVQASAWPPAQARLNSPKTMPWDSGPPRCGHRSVMAATVGFGIAPRASTARCAARWARSA